MTMESTLNKAEGRAALDQLCVNTIRMLSIDGVQKANSGHPGLPLGAAPMAYVLWTHFLKHNPSSPEWFNRDRFVLSAGHGSMLLYSMLHLTGYPLSLEQLKQFRQWGSLTAGHPERHPKVGIEITTGPLGQGFANGVGMAIAEAYLAAHYNRPNFSIIDHYTYAIVSDGDLMEGVAAEAASLAGHLKLGKLIYLYDDNHVTLSAGTQISYTEERAKRFESYGWHTVTVKDGNDLDAIHKAILEAKKETERPSLILVRTIIGFGSPHKQNTYEVHGSPLGEEEVKLTKENFDWPADKSFYIPKEAQEHFHQEIEKGKKSEEEWNRLMASYEKQYPKEANELKKIIKGELPSEWNKDIPEFPADPKGMATRVAGGKTLQAIFPKIPNLIGGSADLNPSTFTEMKDAGDFENPNQAKGDQQGSSGGGWSYAGRNLHYGVREHAMGSISNGLAAENGIIPFTATFLCFSDYMRPAIRLACLMELQVIFVFTHDSIGLGEDGPTHQPIEHFAALRAIPRLIVIRPGDANETAVAWQIAIEMRTRPTALIFSRQNVPTLDRKTYASAQGVRKGAYILSDAPEGKPDLILIATGSELGLIVAAQQKLQEQNIKVRLVSMPSWELFDDQPKEYKDLVFPPNVKARLAVEAGIAQGWEKYVGDQGDIVCMTDFGASAPAAILFKEFGFTVENICKRAQNLLKR